MANFFQNLLKGLTRPIRDLGELSNIVKVSSGKNGYDQLANYQPRYTSKQEAGDLSSKPILQGAKDVANAGSLFTPVGKGLGGLVKSGAVAGGLGGFGGSQQGKELESSLSGAAMGGALGGILGLIPKVSAGLSKSAQKLSQKADLGVLDDITSKTTKLGPKELQQAKTAFISEYKNIAGNTMGISKIDLANAQNDVISSLSSKIDEFANTPLQNAKQSIIEQARQKIDVDLIQKTAQKTGGKSLMDILKGIKKLSDNPTLGEVRTLVTQTDKLLSYGTKGVKTEGAINLQRELDGLRKILRNEIKAVAPADKALTELSKVVKVADSFNKIVDKTPGISIAGAKIGLPKDINAGLQREVTGGLESASKGLANIPTVNTPTQALQSILAGISGVTAQGQTQQDPQGLQTPQEQQGTQQPQQLDFLSALALAQRIFPKGTESELMSLASKLVEGQGGSQGKITEAQAKFNAAGQMAQQALALLESGEAKTGKVASIKSGVEKFIGTQGEAQTAYYSALDAARGAATSALSGASVPPSEYARLKNLVPEPTDEKKVAAQKLRSFAEAMRVYAAGSRLGGLDTFNQISQ